MAAVAWYNYFQNKIIQTKISVQTLVMVVQDVAPLRVLLVRLGIIRRLMAAVARYTYFQNKMIKPKKVLRVWSRLHR
jgi:hypothetical protein